jgi:hypothetical protein
MQPQYKVTAAHSRPIQLKNPRGTIRRINQTNTVHSNKEGTKEGMRDMVNKITTPTNLRVNTP